MEGVGLPSNSLPLAALVQGMGSLSDVGLQSSSDGEELFSTDVSDTRLGWAGEESDSEGFSTDVSDTRRKRRRAGAQGGALCAVRKVGCFHHR